MRYGPRCKSVSVEGLINKLLTIDPNHAEGLKLRGISYAERDFYAEALSCLKQSLLRNEFDPETCYYLGLCHERLNDTHSADMAYGYAAKFGYHHVAWHRRGLLAMRNQDYVVAQNLFQKAVLYNGFHIPSRACYAWCLHRASLKSKALEQLDVAAEIQVSNPLIEAMRYLIKLGSFKGFAEFAVTNQLADQLHGDVQTYLQLVCDIAALGEPVLAAEITDEVVELTAHSRGRGIVPYYQYYFRSMAKLPVPRPVCELSSLKYSFPFRFEEVAIIEFALEQDKNDRFARYYRGMLYASKIRYKEAFECFKSAFDAGLHTPEVANVLGSISANTLNDLELSQKYYEFSLKLETDNLFTLNFMADIYAKRVNDDALKKIFAHPAALSNMDLFAKYIAWLRKHGRVDKTIDVYEKVDFAEMDQGLCFIYFELLVQRGLVKMDAKDYRGALADFKKANVPPKNLGKHQQHRKRRNIQADYFVGKALIGLGKQTEAHQLWEDAINYREQPQDWKMSGAWNYGFWTDRFYQGWMLKELGRTSEAITYFDGMRSEAAHKFRHQYSPAQRRDLLQLAYNGLNDSQIYTKATDTSYLNKE
jgi:tetratricopeptide (TPR) repeat protein